MVLERSHAPIPKGVFTLFETQVPNTAEREANTFEQIIFFL